MPAPAPSGSSLDPALYRKVLGRVPTSVVVVTAQGPDEPVGVTVGSFTSVSLDPPLVAFFCNLGSASAGAIVSAGRFCVNVLAQDQQEVCGAFAGRTGNRFASCAWEPGDDGAPRLHGAAAWIECDLEKAFEAGDHVAIMGRVRRLDAARSERPPLVFHGGRLVRLDALSLRHAATRSFDWWEA